MKTAGKQAWCGPGKLELRRRTEGSETIESKGQQIDYMMRLALLGGILEFGGGI